LHFNSDQDYKLIPNSSSQVELPTNCLRIDTSGTSQADDYVERSRKLWDRKNHTFTITDAEVYVDIVWFLEFTEIPEAARRYITIRASRIFQDRMLASDLLHKFHQVDELQALSVLKEAEGDTRDHSIFNNYDVARTLDRNNFQPED
jgi:hypothetical protein